MISVGLTYQMVQDHPFIAAAGSAVLYLLLLVVYRLTLHPLARIPGPILAAATGAYEAYFQIGKEGGGRYWIEVERLHKIYGR